MEGEQLIKLSQKYSDEIFSRVPICARDRMSIGNFNKRGLKQEETKLKCEKKEYASGLREKRVESRDDKDLDEFRELAAEKITDHARLWPMKTEREQNATMHEIQTKTWWNKVSACSFPGKKELAQQTRFSSEMAYDKKIQERMDEDNEDNDNEDGNTIEND